jgi:hypothetical protein
MRAVDNAQPEASATAFAPVVGLGNANKVLKQRYNEVKANFEGVMSGSGWSVLRTGNNISVESLHQSGGWPVYVRTTTLLSAHPQSVFDAFHWNRLDDTQKKVDPFYESAQLLAKVSKGLLLIRKVLTTPSLYSLF